MSLSWTYFEQLGLLGGLHELRLKFRYSLCSLILHLLKPGFQLQCNTNNKALSIILTKPCSLVTGVCSEADLCIMVLQFIHMLQHPSSVLSILQQGSNIQHIVQICLDLDLQLLTLCLFQTLTQKKHKSYFFIHNVFLMYICANY